MSEEQQEQSERTDAAPPESDKPESSDRHARRDAERVGRESRHAARRVEKVAARSERRVKREAGKAEREAARSSRDGAIDAAGEFKRAARDQVRALKRESKEAARAVKRAVKEGARDARGKKPRRTQEERRDAMRARLLDATVRCLVKHGYSGTSTPKICQLARVSRGAQLHHFPTKESLIVASVEHLVTLRHEEFRKAITALPEHVDRGPVAIDLLWKMISGDTFYAWLELSVAARTDAKLGAAVQELNARCQGAMHETFLEFFPDALGNPMFDVAPDFVFAVLEGLALRKLYSPDDERVGQVLFAIKSLAGVVTPATPSSEAADGAVAPEASP